MNVADPQATPGRAATAGAPWPMIGRTHELASVAEAIFDPRMSSAVVLGAAGSGRTRFLSEALAVAGAAGAWTVALRATTSASTVRFGALRELLTASDPSLDGVAFMDGCVQSIAERARGAQAVLAVDDADLLDPASAAMILELARRRTAWILATVRTGRECPDAIAALWQDDATVIVELDDFDDDTCRQLMEAFVNGPVDRVAAYRAAEAAGADAVYLAALTRSAVKSGSLRRIDGLWTFIRDPAPDAVLVQLVTGELGGLDDAEREIVDFLALSGPLSGEAVERLGASSAASSLEAKGLIVADHDQIKIARPLLGDIVRDSLPLLRTRALRTRLIAVLEVDGQRDAGATVQLTRLKHHAGHTVNEIQALTVGRAALDCGDTRFAAELALAAVRSRRSLEGALLLAQAERRAGHPSDAEQALAGVEDLAPGHVDAAAYARERVALLFWELRRPDEASAFVRRMADWAGDPAWMRFIAGLRHDYEHESRSGPGAVAEGVVDPRTAARAAADARVAVPRRLRLRLGMLLMAGQGDAAARDAFDDLPESGFADESELAKLVTLIFVSLDSGNRWADLDRLLTHVIRDAARTRERAAAGVAAFGHARLLSLRGRYREAARWLTEAEVHLSRRDPFNTIIGVRCAAVDVAVATRNFETARAAHADLQAWAAEHQPLSSQRPIVAQARSWFEALTDPPGAARQLLADAERLGVDLPGLAPGLAYEALRLGSPSAPAVLEHLSAGTNSRLIAAFAQHGQARSDGTPGDLLDVADEMSRIGADRYAVEAASEAAAAFLNQGRRDSARRAAAKAREHFFPDQDATLPAVDGLEGLATGLTPREAMVVELARDRLSNAEIAARLVISIRTVENHLYHSMYKLGVNDRRDL